jgi:IS1 family transposase
VKFALIIERELLSLEVSRLCVLVLFVRSMFHISNINTLKSIYFAYFHSIVQYGIIFWGNSSNSRKIFTLQKKIIRIMVGAHPRTSCRSLFKELEILPVPCQYIFSLMNFLVDNKDNFQTNSSIHSINTSNKHHLHRPIANLSCFQKSTFYPSIRIFNSLPCNIKNEKAQFKAALSRYLNAHSFYSVDQLLMSTVNL